MRTADSRTLCLPLSKEGKIPRRVARILGSKDSHVLFYPSAMGFDAPAESFARKSTGCMGSFGIPSSFTACFSCSRGAGFPLPKWAGRGMAPLPYHKGETYHHLIRGFSQFSQPQNLLPQSCRTQRFIAPDGKGCHPCRKIAHSGPQGQGFFGRATLPLLKSFLWLPGSSSGKDF